MHLTVDYKLSATHVTFHWAEKNSEYYIYMNRIPPRVLLRTNIACLSFSSLCIPYRRLTSSAPIPRLIPPLPPLSPPPPFAARRRLQVTQASSFHGHEVITAPGLETPDLIPWKWVWLRFVQSAVEHELRVDIRNACIGVVFGNTQSYN